MQASNTVRLNEIGTLPYSGQGCYEGVRGCKPKAAPRRLKKIPCINVEPHGFKPIPCRRGTMQQKFLEALAEGASLDDLRYIAIRKDGQLWDDQAILNMMYHDLREKGYGVRSVHDFDRGLIYKLVIPDAV